jgi:hypothetical protein
MRQGRPPEYTAALTEITSPYFESSCLPGYAGTYFQLAGNVICYTDESCSCFRYEKGLYVRRTGPT